MKYLFKKLTQKHNPHTILNDFLELSAISISNILDKENFDKRESRYMEISKKYNDEELKIFSNILGKLAIELEKPKDILGEILMELEEGNSTKGQYFTPFHICLLTTEMAFDEEKLKRDGYLYVDEPACGGGALIIALYMIMKQRGYNPQTQLTVTASDLDLKSTLMCYIQLSLLGVPAKVQHSNAMTGEIFSTWKTPSWISGAWGYKK